MESQVVSRERGPATIAWRGMATSSASPLRRLLAVFIDFMAWFAVWAAIGAVAPPDVFGYALPALLLIIVVLTALFGVSPGRLVTGIRVLRLDGRHPGLLPALVRTTVVFLTGWIGVWIFLLTVQREGGPPRMWWDAAASTALRRVGPSATPLPVDARTAALAGFRLTEEDVAANVAGRLSPRQRNRNLWRAGAYGAVFVVAALVPVGTVVFLIENGFSWGALATLVVAVLIAVGVFVYAQEIWSDVWSGRVVTLVGVPEAGVEEESTGSGMVWKFPYLELEGVHKLGWKAFRSIEGGRAYQLFVLPASGRCVAAVPVDSARANTGEQ